MINELKKRGDTGMRRLRAVLLALMVLFPCLFACASAEQVGIPSFGDFLYSLQADGSAVITGYTGPGGDVSIPADLGGAAVTAIGAEAFRGNNSLARVTLPATVTELGDYAFFYCRSLTSVTLPDSLQVVGRNPFAACESLAELSVSPDHSSLALRDGVLYSLQDRRLVACLMTREKGPCAVADGTKIIGASAFYLCDSLTGLTLPDTVTSIGKAAFYQCGSLRGLDLPDSVSYLGEGAFNGCRALQSLRCPADVTEIGRSAFENCYSLKELILPEGAERQKDVAEECLKAIEALKLRGTEIIHAARGDTHPLPCV